MLANYFSSLKTVLFVFIDFFFLKLYNQAKSERLLTNPFLKRSKLMNRKKSAITQETILKAAIKIFSEKGYSAATTSEIAQEAGVAEGTIFRYFSKKKELLYQIAQKTIDLFSHHIAFSTLEEVLKENETKDAKILLKALIMDRLILLEQYFPYIKVVFYEAQFHEDIREMIHEKIVKKGMLLMQTVFAQRTIAGEFKTIDSNIATRSLIGMIVAMFLQKKFIPSPHFTNNLEGEIDIIIDIFLNGIRNTNYQ